MLDNHKKLLETQRKIRGQQSQERHRERFMQVKNHPVLGFRNKKQLHRTRNRQCCCQQIIILYKPSYQCYLFSISPAAMSFSAMLVVSGYAVKDIAAAVAATVKNKTENRATVCCRHNADAFAMKPLEGVEKGNLNYAKHWKFGCRCCSCLRQYWLHYDAVKKNQS